MRRAFLGLVFLTGCALTNKATPLEPRYFSIELPAASRAEQGPMTSADDVLSGLRLGRIKAASNLKEEIVYRTSPYEVGFYPEKRWSERPETYLRRSLVRSIFEVHGVRQALSGVTPVLDVELVSFEEIRGDKPAARVELMAALHDDAVVRMEHTFLIEKPLPAGQDPADPLVLARAMGEALHDAVEQLATEVARELKTPPAK